MGIYLNPGNDMFSEVINGEIYVDKTELITCTNRYTPLYNFYKQLSCR